MDRHARKSGQSMVEFALLMPILVATLFAIVEISIILAIYVGITNSAREAARSGAIYQETAAVTSTSDVTAMDGRRLQYVSSTITETLSPMINTSLFTTTVVYTPTAALATNMYRSGDTINVQLIYTHRLFFNLFGSRSINLKASSSMRIEPGGVGGAP